MAVDNWLPKPIDGKETGKMEAPLKAVDIRDTLNAFGGKVSNKTTSFFKPEANINKWSKHKPIIDSRPFIPFDDAKWSSQNGSTPDPIMGSNDNKAGLANVFAATSSADDWFEYVLPAGGTAQPLRKGDFRGYRADAFSPFQSFSVNGSPVDQSVGTGDTTTFEIYVRCFLNNELDEVVGGMISLMDLGIFSDSLNTNRLAVIEKFNGEYSLHTGSTLQEEWGRGTIDRKWSNDDDGVHEFKAVIHTDNGYNYVLPFPTRKITVCQVYNGDVIINMSGSLAYKSDRSDGELSASFEYVRGSATSTEDTIYNVPISFTNGDGSWQEQIITATFTIPNTTLTPAGQPVYKYNRVVMDETHYYWNSIIDLYEADDLYLRFGGSKVKVN